MFYSLFLLSALLSRASGAGDPDKVVAFAGGDVILPCSFDVTTSTDLTTVEWSKGGPDHVVFLYRDGCETPEMKHPSFEFRTSFIEKELKHGNISLRISNLRRSDSGTYICKRMWRTSPPHVTNVTLVVGAVSEPRLSVAPAAGRGVTLQCDSGCWMAEVQLQPNITFLDDDGQEIPADGDAKREEDSSGCVSLRRRATLHTATSRVTCRVHEARFNLTRNKDIVIADDCHLTTCIIVSVIIITALLCGFGVAWKTCFLWLGCGKAGVAHGASEKQVLLRPDGDTIKQLERKVAQLKSELNEKDEIIGRLQSATQCQLSPVVCQQNRPTLCGPSSEPHLTTDTSTSSSSGINRHRSAHVPKSKRPTPGAPQRPDDLLPLVLSQQLRHSHSSPDFSSSHAAPSAVSPTGGAPRTKQKQGHLVRSMSESGVRPPSRGSKTHRRHSTSHPPSAVTSNYYSPLAQLEEELS